MALIIVFHNDGTGTERAANYNVEVLVGDGTPERSKTIHRGRFEGHNRADEWDVLVQKYLTQLRP